MFDFSSGILEHFAFITCIPEEKKENISSNIFTNHNIISGILNIKGLKDYNCIVHVHQVALFKDTGVYLGRYW